MVLHLSGELDLAGVDLLEETVTRLSESLAPTILLDLSELEFIDSAGISLLIRLDAACRRDGDRLRIVPGPRPVQRLLELTDADRRLRFTPAA